MDVFVNCLQLAGGIILSIGYIPQIKKVVKTKSMSDFNFWYLLAMFVGVGFMEVYAVYNACYGRAIMFLVTNSIALILGGTMLTLYTFYGRKK